MPHRKLTAISLDLLRDGYTVRFCATGRSMEPTLHEGEQIVVEPVDCAALAVDDVILFDTTRGLTAHRIVEVIPPDGSPDSRPLFLSLGDSFSAWFEPVLAEQILGRVVAVERGGRAVSVDRLRDGSRGRGWRSLRAHAARLRRGWLPGFVDAALARRSR